MADSLLSRKAWVLPLAVALAVTFGGCGDLPGAPAVKPTVPVASTLSEPPVPPDSLSEPGVPQETMPAGTTTPYPQPSCQGGPLGCRAFTSVGGRDGTGELEWLKTQPLEVSSILINNTWTIAVKTPCNMMSVGVTVKGNLLIPGMTLLTQMACQGPEDSYENWTHELFKQAVTWELAGESLVLRNSHGTVELKDSGSNPYG